MKELRSETTPTAGPASQFPRLSRVMERRASWVEALLILAPLAVGFAVLDGAARYFHDYLHLILTFFFAWMLACLISPPADWLQRRLTHLPRPVAVLAVLVPIIVVLALAIAWVLVSLAQSFVHLSRALPGLAENPPPVLFDIQRWLSSIGLNVDLAAAFRSIVGELLTHSIDMMVAALGTGLSLASTAGDSLVVVSLAVFMAIDRDKIMRFGLEQAPPARRDSMVLYRRRVGAAFAGFIRSQLAVGGLYGVWAFLVCVVFGLPFAPAVAFFAGAIMAIPIYGPYVSWLPPVVVAASQPQLALVVAIVMLVGWFIDENILAPIVRAGALDLNPIVVTFAFLLGSQLAGAIGAIVAIPLAAVVQASIMESLSSHRRTQGSEPMEAGPPEPAPADAGPAATVSGERRRSGRHARGA